ncbi:MAG: hypothetical protein ACK5Q5_07960 [Planctomycetaceae bacterium]
MLALLRDASMAPHINHATPPDDLDEVTAAFSKEDVIRFLDKASRAGDSSNAYPILRGWLYQLTVAVKKSREGAPGAVRLLESDPDQLDVVIDRIAFEAKHGVGDIERIINQVFTYKGGGLADEMRFVVPNASVETKLRQAFTDRAAVDKVFAEYWNGGNGFITFDLVDAFYGAAAK